MIKFIKKIFKRKKSIFIYRNGRYEFKIQGFKNKSMSELYDIYDDDLILLLKDLRKLSKLKKEDIRIIDIILSKLN